MRKFLYFQNSTSDNITVNVDHISMMDATGADEMKIYFRSNDAVDFSGAANISITSGYAKQFIRALTKEIAFGRTPFIVVADDTNSDFFTSTADGTTVAATACGTIVLT